MKKNKKALICWLLVVIWMGVIFGFSQKNSTQSSSSSKKIAIKIVDIVEKNKSKKEKEVIAEEIHIPIRKVAHAIEYAILCILLIIALKNSNIKNNKILWIALLISIIYSITDEYHQTLIEGRSGEIKDVLIDSTGALIGLSSYVIINKIKKHKRR